MVTTAVTRWAWPMLGLCATPKEAARSLKTMVCKVLSQLHMSLVRGCSHFQETKLQFTQRLGFVTCLCCSYSVVGGMRVELYQLYCRMFLNSQFLGSTFGCNLVLMKTDIKIEFD